MEIPNNFDEEQQRYAQMMPDYSIEDPYAMRVGFGRRLGAYVIDGLISSIIYYILFFITGASSKMVEMQSAILENQQDPTAMWSAIGDMYATILPLSMIGIIILMLFEIFMAASPGKLALNIRIANSNRTKATLGTLSFRSLIKYGSIFFILLFLLTSSLIWLAFWLLASFIIFIGCFFAIGEKRLALHDMIAKTAVYLSGDIFDSRQSELIREGSTRGEKNIG